MKLSDIVVDAKSVWVDFEGVPGFSVEVNYIPRTEMTRLIRDCQKSEMNRKTRQIEMKLDEDKFIRKLVERAINDWKGLTPKKVNENFVPVQVTAENENVNVPFDVDSAVTLIKESSVFDDWLNEKIADLDSFRSKSV